MGRSNDDAIRPEKKWERERFELSPMVGRMVSDRRLLLYRTVVRERQAYRQGLLVDVDKLGTWLGEQHTDTAQRSFRSAVEQHGIPLRRTGRESAQHRGGYAELANNESRSQIGSLISR